MLRSDPERKSYLAPVRALIESRQFASATAILWYVMLKEGAQMSRPNLISKLELTLSVVNVASFYVVVPAMLTSLTPKYSGNLLTVIDASLRPVVKCGEVNGSRLTGREVADRLVSRVRRELKTRKPQHSILIEEALERIVSVLVPQQKPSTHMDDPR